MYQRKHVSWNIRGAAASWVVDVLLAESATLLLALTEIGDARSCASVSAAEPVSSRFDAAGALAKSAAAV